MIKHFISLFILCMPLILDYILMHKDAKLLLIKQTPWRILIAMAVVTAFNIGDWKVIDCTITVYVLSEIWSRKATFKRKNKR